MFLLKDYLMTILLFYCFYINDMLIIGQHTNMVDRLKKKLSKSFAIKDLGPHNNFGHKDLL